MRLLILVLISVNSITTYAQNAFNDTLLVREWKLDSYTINGKKAVPTAEQEKSRFIFKSDQSSISINGIGEEKGNWSYDPKTSVITITNAIFPEIATKLIVESISIDKLVVRVETEEVLNITMVPTGK